MLLVTNYVYDFSFKSNLSLLDGIYKVNAIMSYGEMLSLNLDLFKITYQPNNLTEVNFNTDLDQIRAGKIVKLVSISNEANIIYVPEHFFDKIPDGSVQKYLHLGLAVDLGIYDDAEQLSVIRSEIEQVISAMLGTTNKTVVYTVNESWMTTSDYAALNDARKASITRVRNHYTDKLDLIKQVDSLKTLISYYEDALKAI